MSPTSFHCSTPHRQHSAGRALHAGAGSTIFSQGPRHRLSPAPGCGVPQGVGDGVGEPAGAEALGLGEGVGVGGGVGDGVGL